MEDARLKCQTQQMLETECDLFGTQFQGPNGKAFEAFSTSGKVRSRGILINDVTESRLEYLDPSQQSNILNHYASEKRFDYLRRTLTASDDKNPIKKSISSDEKIATTNRKPINLDSAVEDNVARNLSGSSKNFRSQENKIVSNAFHSTSRESSVKRRSLKLNDEKQDPSADSFNFRVRTEGSKLSLEEIGSCRKQANFHSRTTRFSETRLSKMSSEKTLPDEINGTNFRNLARLEFSKFIQTKLDQERTRKKMLQPFVSSQPRQNTFLTSLHRSPDSNPARPITTNLRGESLSCKKDKIFPSPLNTKTMNQTPVFSQRNNAKELFVKPTTLVHKDYAAAEAREVNNFDSMGLLRIRDSQEPRRETKYLQKWKKQKKISADLDQFLEAARRQIASRAIGVNYTKLLQHASSNQLTDFSEERVYDAVRKELISKAIRSKSQHKYEQFIRMDISNNLRPVKEAVEKYNVVIPYSSLIVLIITTRSFK